MLTGVITASLNLGELFTGYTDVSGYDGYFQIGIAVVLFAYFVFSAVMERDNEYDSQY